MMLYEVDEQVDTMQTPLHRATHEKQVESKLPMWTKSLKGQCQVRQM
jgi:hypothetical protein